jgi:hypothetical protein
VALSELAALTGFQIRASHIAAKRLLGCFEKDGTSETAAIFQSSHKMLAANSVKTKKPIKSWAWMLSMAEMQSVPYVFHVQA